MLPLVLPLTDEQAKAIQQGSDFGKTVVQETGVLARCIGKILGTIPEDILGIAIGEHLHYLRARIALGYEKRIEALLHERGVTSPEPVSPSIAIPLIQAAYDESRPELQEMWARLIAAAMDGSRSNRVRRKFIETVKQLDPLDAVILQNLYEMPGKLSPCSRDFFAHKLQKSLSEIIVSSQNLIDLRCAGGPNGSQSENIDFFITTYGKELIRACSP